MKIKHASIIFLFFISSCNYNNKSKETLFKSTSVDSLVNALTLSEKVNQLSGRSFDTEPNVKYGIPGFHMTDGPIGVGQANKNGNATAFPAIVALASTWDTTYAYLMGNAIAQEAKLKGRNFLLAPCINIQRYPLGGRNFESFSEDPFLTSKMAVNYINGVQSENVLACAKHFVCNNQERNRINLNVKVGERALREIYFPAFKAAVKKGNVASVMTSYNMVNNEYSGQNNWLINEVLKNEWGFSGITISDWESIYSTKKAANAGLDLEMPWARHFGDSLIQLVEDGVIDENVVNEKVRRILKTKQRYNLEMQSESVDTTFYGNDEHSKLAEKIAKEAIVLLKNEDNALPLIPESGEKIALIGPNTSIARLTQKGSVHVKPYKSISPLQAVVEMELENCHIEYQKGVELIEEANSIKGVQFMHEDGKTGLQAHYYANKNCQGTPVLTKTDSLIHFDWGHESPDSLLDPDSFSARWKGNLMVNKTGDYVIDISAAGGYKLFLNNEVVIDQWFVWKPQDIQSLHVYLESDTKYPIELQYFESEWEASISMGIRKIEKDSLFLEAVNSAKKSDVAVVFAGLSDAYEQEGNDRYSFSLPFEQVELIKEVSKVNPRTIVVINAGTPVDLSSWVNEVEGVIYAWYGGQNSGKAIADVLFGKANPGGKLPFTYPAKISNHPGFKSYQNKDEVVYSEGILVGYRYYDYYKIDPMYCFGHGLSYTTFDYSDFLLEKRGDDIRVRFKVKNTGNFAGTEIPQLYVSKVNSNILRAPRELKGFSKIFLQTGESKEITIRVSVDDLYYFDEKSRGWKFENGEYDFFVGSSLKKTELFERIELKEIPIKAY